MSGRPRVMRLSCDTGEAQTEIGRAAEAELVKLVDVLNIACGGHAGDDDSMREAVGDAAAAGRLIAAHPSYPDRASFGRRPMPLSGRDLANSVADQLAALVGVCESLGVRVTQVKPHGALYHQAANDPATAQAIEHARKAVIPEAAIVMPCSAPTTRWWADRGVPLIAEAFADRRYQADGTLRDRSSGDALIAEPEEAYRQARYIAGPDRAIAVHGQRVALKADQLCVHSDGVNAVAVARRVRAALDEHAIL